MSFKISVIIPNYNYGRFIGEAVESVLAQTFPVFEIVVVDDGSTDDSLEILSRYEKDGVKVVRQQNCGVGAARNSGVEHSSGELVAFLDADDLWLPQKIEKQMERLLSDPEFGFVSCGMKEFDASGNTIRAYEVGKEGWRAEEILLIEPIVNGPGSTGLLWRRVFEEAGGFDETKEMHPSEDWEFCYRVARVGKIAFVPELLVGYRNHGNNGHLQIPRVERAVGLAVAKIYRNAPPEVEKFRHRSYGKMHYMLSGFYFQAGQTGKSIRHGIKSVLHDPGNLTKILGKVFKKKSV
jgi:glycosyltransferase involved in cell wall biosynthesis